MRRAAVVVAGAVLLLSGCNTQGYAFRVDESIDVVAPKARSTVNLPVTIRWTDENAATADRYGVFVDRAPIAAGRRLKERDRDVYLTDTPRLTLELLDDLRPSTRGSSKDPHEVTIVRMQGDRRVGEAAFRVTFFVRR